MTGEPAIIGRIVSEWREESWLLDSRGADDGVSSAVLSARSDSWHPVDAHGFVHAEQYGSVEAACRRAVELSTAVR